MANRCCGLNNCCCSRGPTGPTGPTGGTLSGSVVFDPYDAPCYVCGQTVIYGGNVYVVVNCPPSGIPGTSIDYERINISGGITGATGPAGPTATCKLEHHN